MRWRVVQQPETACPSDCCLQVVSKSRASRTSVSLSLSLLFSSPSSFGANLQGDIQKRKRERRRRFKFSLIYIGKHIMSALPFCSEIIAAPCCGSQTGNKRLPLQATIAVAVAYFTLLLPLRTCPTRSPPWLSPTPNAPFHLPSVESSVIR